ncbi:MaoC family dehydratase [Pseudonocardia acaciae]|uniref:MaoC family dehydratase n=1 Tax=Pseudonocardia acaciae TaxID=551276 RepID=UPI00056182DD|nr:MaoC/PaaZ C-terminal domain-containing protein [Pseudonocardia acaciae]
MTDVGQVSGDLFWDDLRVGMRATSPGRTITESDVMTFAGLSGDFNQLHVDAVFAAEQGFGGNRLVYGILGVAIASGLHTRTWLGTGTQRNSVALLELQWNFAGPIFINDTVTLTVSVVDLRPTSDGRRGIVKFERLLTNHDGLVVQRGTTVGMMKRKPGESGS